MHEAKREVLLDEAQIIGKKQAPFVPLAKMDRGGRYPRDRVGWQPVFLPKQDRPDKPVVS